MGRLQFHIKRLHCSLISALDPIFLFIRLWKQEGLSTCVPVHTHGDLGHQLQSGTTLEVIVNWGVKQWEEDLVVPVYFFYLHLSLSALQK